MSGAWASLRQRPRRYQAEAARWALERRRGVVVLPTGTGKTLVAVLWVLGLLERGLRGRVLFLEPTRFLVEQVARYVRWVSGLEAEAVHGAVPRGERARRWRARVVVATPEVVLADWDWAPVREVEAVVVDECHHTTGKDAYKEVMNRLSWVENRLGLSAYIPPSRRREIEETIGPIREWSWSDPSVAPYIPPWIGEVYEAELNEAERRLYERLEEEAENAPTPGLRTAIRNALRWLVRDGALALRDSMERRTSLAEVLRRLRGLILDPGVRPAHKWESFTRLIRDHEGFSKAIVFIDRVVVAEYVCRRVSEELGLGCVLIRGRMGREALREALERAHSPEARVIVSTSAGEEGIDLPEADLLVMWSISASPLRFIQRHGRVLRARGEGAERGPPKYVAYIVTLDTIDVDSFVDAIEAAKRAGVDVPVDPETVEALWRRTTRSRIISVLEGHPMPVEMLSEATGIPLERLRRDLQRLMRHGDVVYIYTSIGRIYAYAGDLELLEERFGEYLDPVPGTVAKVKYIALGSRSWGRAVSGTYDYVYDVLSRRLREHGGFERVHASLEVGAGGLIRLINLVYTFLVDTVDKLELVLRNIYAAPRIVEEVGSVPT